MDSQPSNASSISPPASLYHPTSKSLAIPASKVVKVRQRSSIVQPVPNEPLVLSPPPSRPRKIIQMKPRGQPEEAIGSFTNSSKNVAGKTTLAPRKKQSSSMSGAGGKIARKKAHSLIERQRRSKINKEFGVLVGMIPACTRGMQKLTILQASVDYIRYLEDCIAKLQAGNNRINTPISDQFALPTVASRGSYSSSGQYPAYDDRDVEMSGSENLSPTNSTPLPNSHQPSASLAFQPQDSRNCQNSYSSASTDQRHYIFNASSTTSPAVGSAAYDYASSTTSVDLTLASPVWLPQMALDQEATAAPLMLNADQRGTRGSISGMGMRIKDLLS